jgi:hypothetical protein
MQQEDRRAGAAMAHSKDYFADVDPFQCEAVEHEFRIWEARSICFG